MKKIYFLLSSIAIIIVTITACEKSSLEIDDLQTLQEEELSFNSKKAKARLCHSDETGGFIANALSQKAVDAHLKHGDRYVYSPKEVWTIIKTNTSNGSVHIWDVNVDQFNGVDFSGTGSYNLIMNGTTYLTGLKVWGTVDNSNGDMDIFLEWDISSYFGSTRKITWNFGGTTCMCSGINEVHSTSNTWGPHQFSLDQPAEICITY